MHRLSVRLSLCLIIIFLAMVFGSPSRTAAEPEPFFAPLQERLIKDGVNESWVRAIYQDPHLVLDPRILAVNLKRSEKTLDYNQFLTDAVVLQGKQYYEEYREQLEKAQAHFGVPAAIVVAILSVETRLGTYTGKHSTVNVLSTMAVADDPQVQERVFSALPEPMSKAEFKVKIVPRLKERAKRGYRDLKALLEYAAGRGMDPLTIKGSSEGAIGIPQFLPSNIATYGYDGNGDGIIDLFEHGDAIVSVASFLHAHRWSVKDEKEVLLHYNRSTYYVNAVVALADRLEQTASVK